MKIILEQESGLMQVLWEHGTSMMTEVPECLQDTPAYTHAPAMLQNLSKDELQRIQRLIGARTGDIRHD
jgi:hypothetical protein